MTSTSTSTSTSASAAVSLPGLIASLHATVDAIVAADPTGESLDDLAGAIEQLHILGNKVDAADMRLLGAYDAAGGAQIAGHRTTGDWLANTTGITSAAAGWRVHTARALRDDLPDTATRWAAGDQPGACAGHPRCPPDPGRGLRQHRGHGGRDRRAAHPGRSAHDPGGDHPAVPPRDPRRPRRARPGPPQGRPVTGAGQHLDPQRATRRRHRSSVGRGVRPVRRTDRPGRHPHPRAAPRRRAGRDRHPIH